MIAPELVTARPGPAWRRRLVTGLGLLTILHGAIHLMAPADIWDLAELDQEVSPSVEIGEAALDALAVGWAITALVLAFAGVMLLLRRPSWTIPAFVGVVASQILIVLWWGSAWVGTIPNALILLGVVLDRRLRLTAR